MKNYDVLREFILEAINPVPLRLPRTPSEKEAFIELARWAGKVLSAPSFVVNSAVASAEQDDDWSEAMGLVRDFYVMKGIKFQIEH